jgi:ADP-ribose pyrophosphatase
MLCYCRSDDSILFVNQYRPVQQKDTWEIPSGLIEAAESPSEAAIRELREETGLIIEDAMLAGKVYSSVGLTTEVIWIFYAEVSTIHIDCEEPDLEVAWVSRSDAIVQMRVDQPCDAKTMLAILWLDKKIGSETC